jgi:nicotinamidase/pyrazinamidase
MTAMEALIMVDLQNDFLPAGSLPVPRGDEIIPLVNKLQEKFGLVVATQDWHPQDHGSFASNHPGKKPYDKGELGGLEQVLWPDHCVQGKKGAEFSRCLKTKRVEAIFRKGMDPTIDSYSGFFDNGHKKATGLGGYLRDKQVDTVYVAGLAGDYCVFYTILDARLLGLEAVLIKDATRPISQAGFRAALKTMAERGARTVLAAEVLKRPR